MEVNLGLRNIVLVGEFDLSLFDKYFFIKNHIFSEDQFLPVPASVPLMGPFISTRDFTILINPNQIIITSKQIDRDDSIADIVKLLVRSSGIKVKSAGFNFHWVVFTDDNQPLPEVTRRLFYSPNNMLMASHFDVSNAAYGTYLSKDFHNSRLKLDVKPTVLKSVQDTRNSLILVFNFHFENIEIDSDVTNDILAHLSEHAVYAKEAEKISSVFK